MARGTERPLLDPERYRVRGYAGYRERAKDPLLSLNEKCAAPDIFRTGYNEKILADIGGKLTALSKTGARICDIGAGCSELAQLIVETTGRNRQSLTAIDSPEMLALLPDAAHLSKLEGPFPACLAVADALGPFDAVLAYGVASVVFEEANLFAFVRASFYWAIFPTRACAGGSWPARPGGNTINYSTRSCRRLTSCSTL